MSAGSNPLSILAANIRTAHEGVLAVAETAAERAIEAGQALLEGRPLSAPEDGCGGCARIAGSLSERRNCKWRTPAQA